MPHKEGKVQREGENIPISQALLECFLEADQSLERVEYISDNLDLLPRNLRMGYASQIYDMRDRISCSYSRDERKLIKLLWDTLQ